MPSAQSRVMNPWYVARKRSTGQYITFLSTNFLFVFLFWDQCTDHSSSEREQALLSFEPVCTAWLHCEPCVGEGHVCSVAFGASSGWLLQLYPSDFEMWKKLLNFGVDLYINYTDLSCSSVVLIADCCNIQICDIRMWRAYFNLRNSLTFLDIHLDVVMQVKHNVWSLLLSLLPIKPCLLV